MAEAATLTRPSTRDEDWRYADTGFLADSDVGVLTHWRTLDVPAGETKREITTHSSGETAKGMVDRLRVNVGKGGRFEAFITLAGGKYQRVEIEVTLEEGAHFEFWRRNRWGRGQSPGIHHAHDPCSAQCDIQSDGAGGSLGPRNRQFPGPHRSGQGCAKDGCGAEFPRDPARKRRERKYQA